MHPILFTIPGLNLPIHSFGVLLAAAFLVSMWRIDRYANQLHLDRDKLNSLVIWIIVSVILGCRILYFLVHPSQFSVVTFLKFWEGGLVFYGGFILAIVVGIWKAKRYGFHILVLSDIMLVATFLGVFIGRWGCLMVGDDFGKPADPSFPFAWKVPNPLPERSLFPPPPPDGELYLHPTQIYMSLNGLMLFFIGHWILKRQLAWGIASSALLVLYAITRSFIEIFRGDHEARGFVGPLSTSQAISIPIALIGIAGLVYFYRRRGDEPVFEAAAREPPAASDS